MKKIALFTFIFTVAGVANADNGRPLNKAERQALIKSVKAQLKDPDSAKFKLGNLLDLKDRHYCGLVNSKNSFGGYVGFMPFYAILFEKEKGGYSPYVMGMDGNPEVTIMMCAQKGYMLY